ncbi:hypothetical protein CVT24_011326 [Panaeolus cyanescens]|uniref:G-patch domain-containing protein n=1 Tax=Panaeolus cyanescens TaxID=181874 RepID=A0A409WDS3_9AGAR|nr:hypothetical protein CVT24_011326 [Panaeolus cyanescens]
MATISHHVYSHYDPEERELLEKETGQLDEPEDDLTSDEAWKREASKASRPVKKPPPRFVSAVRPYDDWMMSKPTHSTTLDTSQNALGNSLSSWYRSLNRKADNNTTNTTNPTTQNSENVKSNSSLPSAPSSSSQAMERSSSSHIMIPKESRSKNNWFIMNALSTTSPPARPVSAPSLSDILDRDPPPVPSQGKKFTPPVWMEIGPSNKGFELLQRSGWNEGEALGPTVARRKPETDLHLTDESDEMIPLSDKSKGKAQESPRNSSAIRQRRVEVKVEGYDDVSELRDVTVIDLTASDSETEDIEILENVEVSSTDAFSAEQQAGSSATSMPSTNINHAENGHSETMSIDESIYEPTALLTPIPTVLKSDRLGIGLKAKTVGPYKASMKRVTHNAAALATHMKAAEESRKRIQKFGRGRRGLERKHRKEQEERNRLLSEIKGLNVTIPP